VAAGAGLAIAAEVALGIDVTVDWPTAVVALLLGTAASMVTSVAPAYYAARINVIDAVQRQ
jgi:ABC-type antimicrobial peptide transport system permease subunit